MQSKKQMLKTKAQSESEGGCKTENAVKKYEDTVWKILNFIYFCGKNEEKRMSFAVAIPDTENSAVLTYEPGRDGWVYSVGTVRKGSDMLVSNYLKHGSKEDVMEYLKSDKALVQTLDAIRKLSNDVDERVMF